MEKCPFEIAMDIINSSYFFLGFLFGVIVIGVAMKPGGGIGIKAIVKVSAKPFLSLWEDTNT